MKTFIVICDDENIIASKLEAILLNIFDSLKLACEVDVYYSGAQLYKAIEAGAHYDLLFLDIEFAKDEINGIEVGRLIREVNCNHHISIVYISWEKDYSIDLHNVQPLDFLVKPLIRKKVEKVIERYLTLSKRWETDFSYKVGQEIHKVKFKNIVYFESIDRKIIIHLENGHQDEFYGSLKKLYQAQLEKYDFLYIHSSYVVNYDFVINYAYTELKLENVNASFPISQGRQKNIRSLYYSIVEKRRS